MYFTDHSAVVITLPLSSKKARQTDFPVGLDGENKTNGEKKKTYGEDRNDVYETLCHLPFACQEGFISFQ